MHADCNGVTSVPHTIAAEVADIADPFVAAETVVLDATREAPGSLARLREARQEMAARIAALRKQVSRQRG